MRPTSHRLIRHFFGLALLAGGAALAQTEGLFIFPREYWRMENDQRVVGHHGRPIMLETADGESFEVVQFTPARSEQREKSLLLFTTEPPKPDKDAQTLKRPIEQWRNGRFVPGTFEQLDLVDRRIYRRNSKALDERIGSLYETAQLDADLEGMLWLVNQAAAAKLLDAELTASAHGAKSWLAARVTVRSHAERRQLIAILRHELAGFATANARLDELAKALATEREKVAKLDTEIAALEKAMGDRQFDKHHPDWRSKELTRLDAWECRAEIDFLEKEIARVRVRQAQAVALSRELLELTPPEGAEPAPATVALVADLDARLAAADDALAARQRALPTAEALLTEVAARVDEALAGLPADNQKATTLKANWAAAFPQGIRARVNDHLVPLGQAIEEIPTLDYGTYRLTMISQYQGIENCLGTPIVVTAGGVERTLWPYQWPGADQFGELSWLIDFREPADLILDEQHPRGQGAIAGIIRSYEHYNAIRLRGWEFAGSTTLSRLADTVFAGKREPLEAWRQLAAIAYGHRGTFDLTVALSQTRRHLRGMASPDASLDALVLDAFILDPVPESPLVLRQAIVQKNWYKPGEDQAVKAWLHNRTDAPQTGSLRTIWITGIDRELTIDERQVTVAPRSAARVVIPCPTPAEAGLWGQEIRVELTIGGQTQRETDVFSIHPNTYAVMMHGGHLGYHPYRQPKSFANHNETFSATFCDSVYVLPDDLLAPYLRSMSDVLGQILQSRAEAQRNNRLGVASVHYISPLCTGHKSYEMYKKHPEWFPERLKWTEAMDYNHRQVAKIGTEAFYSGNFEKYTEISGEESPYPLLHLEQPINMACQQIWENLVEDLITFSYAVDWDGARWDGGPMLVWERDFLGRPINHFETGDPLTTIEQRKDVAAKRLREMKRRVWEHHPDWVYGNNGDTFGYGGTLLSLDQEPPPIEDYPQYQEFMKDGGGYMDEGWMNAYMYADNRNKADSYLRLAFKQAHAMKAAGGYLQTFSPQRDGTGHFDVDDLYYNLLPHIAGATYYGQLSASPWSDDGPIYFFERFSEFFLNNALRPLPEAAARVNVDLPDVWAHEIATIQPLAEDHVRVIVPIVNKHPRERLYDTQNRYSVLPRVVEQPFAVSVQAPAGFEGVTQVAYELTCEPRTAARRLAARQEGDRTVVDLPRLGLFTVVVMEYRRANR